MKKDVWTYTSHTGRVVTFCKRSWKLEVRAIGKQIPDYTKDKL